MSPKTFTWSVLAIILRYGSEDGAVMHLLITKGAYEGVDACVMAHPSRLHDGHGEAMHSRVLGRRQCARRRRAQLQLQRCQRAAPADAPDRPRARYHRGRRPALQHHPEPRPRRVLRARDRVLACFRVPARSPPPRSTCPMLCDLDTTDVIAGATNQGNIGFVVPVIHPICGIEAKEGQFNHSPGFAEVAGGADAFERTLKVGKGLARTAWVVLTDDGVYEEVKREFDEKVASRRTKMAAEDEFKLISMWDESAFSGAARPVRGRCVCGHQ